ncbi:hypothetical protein [Archangium violaceum]|uniref:hypothetical protein n=1 Tax=Archangium violaceum TaxID=83451 RepID=UPI0036DAF14C
MKTGQAAALLAAVAAAGVAVYLYRRWSQAERAPEAPAAAPSLASRLGQVATAEQVSAAMTKLQENVAAKAASAAPAARPALPGAAGQTPGTPAAAKLPATVVKAMAEPVPVAAPGSAAAKLKPGVVGRGPMGTTAAPTAAM